MLSITEQIRNIFAQNNYHGWKTYLSPSDIKDALLKMYGVDRSVQQIAPLISHLHASGYLNKVDRGLYTLSLDYEGDINIDMDKMKKRLIEVVSRLDQYNYNKDGYTISSIHMCYNILYETPTTKTKVRNAIELLRRDLYLRRNKGGKYSKSISN